MDAHRSPVTPELRKLAARTCTYMGRDLGMSWVDAADALAEGMIEPPEALEALRALDRAGELEHLFHLVFVGRMKLQPR